MHRRVRRERTLFYRELRAICCWSYRHAYAVIAVTALLCIPAFWQASQLGLDTDLTRLLPENSRAARWSRRLEPVVGDGGYFSIVFEGGPPDRLRAAVQASAARLERLDGLDSVDYRYPTGFLQRYKYALLPSRMLLDMEDEVASWEAEVNPFVDDLGLGDDGDTSDTDADNADRLESLVQYYRSIPDYHQNPDGTMFGMLLHANQGLSNLGGVRTLYEQIRDIVQEEAGRQDVQVSVGGSLRSRVEEFEVIISDVRRSGFVAIIAILLTLVVSFRSVRVLPVLVYPLAFGLLVSFAFVPWMVGDLNTITSFMLMILFGMGIDYSIHLVKRFRHELCRRDAEAALIETFTSTGRSVGTSGWTTAFGLLILAISEFRGFSDFGIIGGVAMVMVTLAMLFLMPATLVIGYRLGLVSPRAPKLPSRHVALPPPWAAAGLSVLVLASAALSGPFLHFDYDFANVSASLQELDAIKEKEREIYPVFFGPSAIYVAPDLQVLDRALGLLELSRDQPGSVIGQISSVRDFAPSAHEWQERLDILARIQESLSGRWTRRIEDQDRLELIDDVVAFVPPDDRPHVSELPASVVDNLEARDGSGRYVIAVNISGNPKDGRRTMELTRELYDIQMPPEVLGPTGDKPVLAEILWLVTSEAPLIVVLTFLGIFILVIIDRRSMKQASWVLVPLVASLLLTFGALIALGWRLNFFNMVVLPALLGLGVDHGVHYYRRWRELHNDTASTQLELFEPISVATLTTIMGYAGMAFAHHPGLRSIGNVAIVGLTCTWVTALVLLPGLLGWRETNRSDELTDEDDD